MKPIEKILHTISIFYYVFVALFVISVCYGFVVGVISTIHQPSIDISLWSTSNYILLLISSLTMTVVSIWSIVLFVRLLICIGRSIARKDIFNMQTVRLINRYAVMYSILVVVLILNRSIMPQVREDTMLEMYQIGSLLTEISSVVILLMFAQVLKIGYILKEDLELTV